MIDPDAHEQRHSPDHEGGVNRPPDEPRGSWPPEDPGRQNQPRTGLGFGALVAWIVILGAVSFVAILPLVMEAVESPGELTEAEYETTVALEEALTRLQGRYLLGVYRVMGGGDQLLGQINETLNVGTPSNRMRVIALVGEIGGPEEARARLEELVDDVRTAEEDDEATRFNRLSEDQRTALAGLQRLYDVGPDETPAVDALTTEQKDAIRDELGWFGRLALHPEGTSDQAARDELIGSAEAVALTVLIAVFGLGGVAVLGFIGIVLMLIFGLMGSLKGGLAPGGGRSGIYAETFALWIVAFLVLTGGAAWVGTAYVPTATMLLIFVAFFASLIVLAWPVIRGVPWSTARTDIGLTCGRSNAFVEVLWGLAGYAMALPVLGVGVVLTLVLLQIQNAFADPGQLFEPMAGPAHPIVLELARGNAFVIVQVLLVATVAAPVIEETVFRGLLYRHLRDSSRWLGPALSVAFATLLNAFIFAIIHPQGVVAVPALMSLAISFSLMREFRDSLISPMVMHGVSNGIMLGLATIALAI